MSEKRQGTLADRTVDYGLAAMGHRDTLPRTSAGRHIGDQLLRSATSVAANYAEATEAESPADFVHKLKISMKELKESRVWLLFASRLVPGDAVEALHRESRELMLMLISPADRRPKGSLDGVRKHQYRDGPRSAGQDNRSVGSMPKQKKEIGRERLEDPERPNEVK